MDSVVVLSVMDMICAAGCVSEGARGRKKNRRRRHSPLRSQGVAAAAAALLRENRTSEKDPPNVASNRRERATCLVVAALLRRKRAEPRAGGGASEASKKEMGLLLRGRASAGCWYPSLLGERARAAAIRLSWANERGLMLSVSHRGRASAGCCYPSLIVGSLEEEGAAAVAALLRGSGQNLGLSGGDPPRTPPLGRTCTSPIPTSPVSRTARLGRDPRDWCR
jgi:hypothetical protein